MSGHAVSDTWEDVWAEYDARQRGLAAARPAVIPAAARPAIVPAAQPVRSDAPRRPARAVWPWWQATGAILAGGVVLALWLAMPWLLSARLSAAIGAADAPALMRQLDAPAAMASLRAGLDAEVPEGVGEGAQRFLSGMADRMAASWQTPAGLRAWLALRARGGPAEGSPVPLSTLRSARPIGLAAFRLEYGPARGAGGVAFDLAWQQGDFRVVGVHFLEPASRPWPAAVLAMR